MDLAIETIGLTRSFGRRVVVAGVDLAVPERSVFGFLGRNGAGKTTTIRLLLGLLRPSAGSAAIFGLDVGRRRREVAGHVGALVEVPSPYAHLTGRENLAITRRLRGAARAEIDRVLEVVGLAGDADRRVGGYSLGMRQRLGVARALVGRPRLLILDEPSNGLDPNGIRDMRRLIASLPEREGVTVFLSSHLLAEVEQCATHVGLMHEGRLVLQSSMRALKASQTRSIRLQTDRPADAAALLTRMGLAATAAGPDEVLIADTSRTGIAAHAIAAVNRALVERGFAVWGIRVSEPSLEDIFLSTLEGEEGTGHAGREGADV